MIRVLCVCVLALATLVGCVAPSQHDETKWGVVRFGLGPSIAEGLPWLPGQVAEIEKALATLSALGPTVVIVPEGSADWVLRPFISPNCDAQAGRFAPGSKFGECDPACTKGYMGLRTCILHESGHLLGMQHICLKLREEAYCSPVGYGYAFMNPGLYYGDALSDMDISVSTDMPTDLDLAEYRRVHP